MIDMFNSILGRFFEASFYLFRDLNAWLAMTAISLLTALLMLFVYRKTSDQDSIRAVKDKILAHLLEIRLYRNSLPITFKAQGRILWYNLRYLGHSARPMLIMIVPLVLAIIQIDLWFGFESLKPGDSVIIKVRLRDRHQPSREAISLEPAPWFAIETPPLRIDDEGEVDWRLRATEPGVRELVVRINKQAVTKQIVVSAKSLARVSPVRVARNWLDQLVSPGEPSISPTSAVKMIEIGYPARRMSVFGWRLHWLIVYFVISMFFGFALKRPFRVEF